MIGATTITGIWMSVAQAAFPAVVGVPALVVARARWSDGTRWRVA
jgi:hypothetical protein